MRTQTTSPRRQDHDSKAASRLAALGLAAAVAAMATAACGGGGGKTAGGTSGGTVNGKTSTSQAPVATPSAPQTFDPAQGPVQDPATLPKTCNGMITDADVQVQTGGPLAGSTIYTAYLPVTGINQTKKVKCQYGEVLDAAGKFQSDQLEVQMATYTDAASAKSRGASTVADLVAKGAQFKQESVDGHPATFVSEGTDVVLVMYDGNRTFLVTVQAALSQGDKAEKLALSFMSVLYKHTLPAGGGAVPTSGATPAGPGSATPAPGGSATPAPPTTVAATPGGATPSA